MREGPYNATSRETSALNALAVLLRGHAPFGRIARGFLRAFRIAHGDGGQRQAEADAIPVLHQIAARAARFRPGPPGGPEGTPRPRD